MRLFWLVALGLSSLYGQQASPQYRRGCPDTTEIRGLYGLAKFQKIVSEIDAFRGQFRIMPRPCFALVNLYYGLSQFALQDTLSGRISWESLLKHDPETEIFDLNLPLPVQWHFDEIKLRLSKQGAIRYAFLPDYIPPTFPKASDSPDLSRLRTLFHNARLDAYSGETKTSEGEVRGYLAQCERKKSVPDPALLLTHGELICRTHSTDKGLLLQASLSVEAGVESNKRQKSKIVDSLLLMGWGDRILERLVMQKKQAGK